MSSKPAIQVLAPAKLNLGLRVLNRRSDGYHNIESMFQAVSLFDTLTIRRAEKFEFLAKGKWQVPTDVNNLVVKAITKLCEFLSVTPNFQVFLEKSIPPGGGLGGGSSDAVAALVGCNELLGFPLKKADLSRIALSIGSDCPFFIEGGLQHVSGRGEVLRPISSQLSGAFAIWFPGASVATSSAYSLLRRSLTQEEPKLILDDCFLSTHNWWEVGIVVNDFEPVVSTQFLEWKDAVLFWKKNSAVWISLTGSGSCQAAYFTDKSACERACEAWPLQGTVWSTEPISFGVRTNKDGDE